MNKTKIEDLCRLASELAENAVVLRTYRLDFLAKRLDSVRQFLDSMRQADGQTKPDSEAAPGSGAAIIVLRKFRKNRHSQRSSRRLQNTL
jgi:hypothetical protein